MKLRWHIAFSGVGAIWAVTSCGSGLMGGKSSSSDNPSAAFGSGSDASIGLFGGNGAASGAGGASAGGVPQVLGPEKETKASFELPHAGPNYVYVALPDSNSVAVIDAKTTSIQTVEAGAQPRYLQTFGGMDAAIVLNVGSSDATIVRTDTNRVSTTSKVLVQPGSNAIAVAPDGKHAVVYYDASLSSATGLPGDLQSVDVITLAAGADASVVMTIGFHPSSVFFSVDGAKAFIVTDDGVSILDFAAISAPGLADLVPLGAPGIVKTLDVSVTNDGQYALARQDNASVLRLVDLQGQDVGKIRMLDVATLLAIPGPDGGTAPPSGDSGAPPHVTGDAGPGGDGAAPPAPTTPPPTPTTPPPSPLPPAPVTDLDLAPSSAYALAMVRDRHAVVRLPIPGAFADPSVATVTTVPGETIGSATISPNGTYALLYTTADDTNERLTVLGLDTGEVHSYQLQKSIVSVAVSPDDGTALIIHKKLLGDPNEMGIDLNTRIDRTDGYSVVQLATGRYHLVSTAAPPGPFAIVPDGTELFVLFNAPPALFQVHRVDLGDLAQHSIDLGSPPLSVGAVPNSHRAFVGQDHPDGRISFIDWTTGALQSVTGFELNSRIRQ